jgi:hypothetical protein
MQEMEEEWTPTEWQLSATLQCLNSGLQTAMRTLNHIDSSSASKGKVLLPTELILMDEDPYTHETKTDEHNTLL